MARDTKNRQPASAGSSGKGEPSSNAAAAQPPARKKAANPLKFFSEVRQEARKVTWTSRRETIVSTIMVVVMAVIAAVFFFLVDLAIGAIVNLILNLGA